MPDYKQLKDALYKNLYKPAEKGFKNSNIGLAAGLGLGWDAPVEPEQFGNLASIASEMLSGTVEAAFDSPFYAIGGLATAAAAPPMAPIGAVAFSSLIKNAYKNAYRKDSETSSKYGGLIDILKNTGYDTAIPAGLGIGAKAAPIVYKATLKPIVNEAGRQAADKVNIFADKLLKELTAQGYPPNANIFRRKNELVDVIDLNAVEPLKERIKVVLNNMRNKLPQASNKRPYIYNKEKDTYADVNSKFIPKSESLANNNPQYMRVSRKAAQELPEIYNKAFSVKSYPSYKKNENTKYIDRKLAAVREGNNIFPIKFTQKEYADRNILSTALLNKNKWKDYGLYSMEVNQKPPVMGRAQLGFTSKPENASSFNNSGGKISIGNLLKSVNPDSITGGYELNNKEYAKRLFIDALLSIKRRVTRE